MPPSGPETFDPHAKEARLRSEAQSWDTSRAREAGPGDIPVIDLSGCLGSPGPESLEPVADQVRAACTVSGFFAITGHGFPREIRDRAFRAARAFHSLPAEEKSRLEMDRPGWPVKGVGYLPFDNFKLPARDRGNLNESFILKRDHRIGLEDNQWPSEAALPGFREAVSAYAERIEALAQSLVPVFARALRLEAGWFGEAFETPMFRMRLIRYRPMPGQASGRYGIAPHVDTSFFTILAQDSPGLVVFNDRQRAWIRVPDIEDALIVNSGELLRQWSNDYFLSARHFASNPGGDGSRYSIPFFFNARPDYVMECLPTCTSDDNPPRYPPISYLQSQGVVQGE